MFDSLWWAASGGVKLSLTPANLSLYQLMKTVQSGLGLRALGVCFRNNKKLIIVLKYCLCRACEQAFLWVTRASGEEQSNESGGMESGEDAPRKSTPRARLCPKTWDCSQPSLWSMPLKTFHCQLWINMWKRHYPRYHGVFHVVSRTPELLSYVTFHKNFSDFRLLSLITYWTTAKVSVLVWSCQYMINCTIRLPFCWYYFLLNRSDR